MYRFAGSASLTLAVALLVACGAPASSTSQAVTVRGTDALKFDPTAISVEAGRPVQLTLTSTGQLLHDWSLAEGAAQPVKIEAAGGQSVSATFSLERPGVYTYICSQPGHEAAGMKGTITAS